MTEFTMRNWTKRATDEWVGGWDVSQIYFEKLIHKFRYRVATSPSCTDWTTIACGDKSTAEDFLGSNTAKVSKYNSLAVLVVGVGVFKSQNCQTCGFCFLNVCVRVFFANFAMFSAFTTLCLTK